MARAAARLGMAVQTVSTQVRELERSLGHALLKPAGRGLALTEAGTPRCARPSRSSSSASNCRPRCATPSRAPGVRLTVGISDGLPKLVVRACWSPCCDAAEPAPAVPRGRIRRPARPISRCTGWTWCSPTGRRRPTPTSRLYSHTLASSPLAWYAPADAVRRARRGLPANRWRRCRCCCPRPTRRCACGSTSGSSAQGVTPHVVGEFEDSALLATFGAAGWACSRPRKIAREAYVALSRAAHRPLRRGRGAVLRHRHREEGAAPAGAEVVAAGRSLNVSRTVGPRKGPRRAAVRPRTRPRPLRIRIEVRTDGLRQHRAVPVAEPRLSRVCAQGPLRVEARAAARAVSRVQADARRTRAGRAGDGNGRSPRLRGAAAATEGSRQSVALLELVRDAHDARPRRSRDRRRADPQREPALSHRPQAGAGRGHVGRRRAGGGAGGALSGPGDRRGRAFGTRVRRGEVGALRHHRHATRTRAGRRADRRAGAGRRARLGVADSAAGHPRRRRSRGGTGECSGARAAVPAPQRCRGGHARGDDPVFAGSRAVSRRPCGNGASTGA